MTLMASDVFPEYICESVWVCDVLLLLLEGRHQALKLSVDANQNKPRLKIYQLDSWKCIFANKEVSLNWFLTATSSFSFYSRDRSFYCRWWLSWSEIRHIYSFSIMLIGQSVNVICLLSWSQVPEQMKRLTWLNVQTLQRGVTSNVLSNKRTPMIRCDDTPHFWWPFTPCSVSTAGCWIRCSVSL